MLNTLRYQFLAIIWAIFTVVLCTLPSADLPNTGRLFAGFDKLAHTGFFFVLTVLLFFGKIRQQSSYEYRVITIIKILLIGAFLGIAIEFLQWKWFTYRSADKWDLFCDMVGVGMGVFGYVFLHRFKFNENSH